MIKQIYLRSVLIALAFTMMITSPVRSNAQGRSRPRKAPVPSSAKPVPKQSAAISDPTKPTSNYLNTPFDPTVDSLPVQFLGHDLRAIVWALDERQNKSQKGEFETTAAYNNRRRIEQARPLPGGIPTDGRFAIVIPNLETSYDADLGILRIEKLLNWASEKEDAYEGDRRSVEWSREVLEETKYPGSNAFGAVTTVTRLRATSYVLVLADTKSTVPEWARDYFSNHRLSISLSLSPAEAMTAKAALRLLIIGRLAAEPYTKGSYHRQPTMDSPNDTIITYRNLVIQAEEAWIFNMSTGHIYLKLRKH